MRRSFLIGLALFAVSLTACATPRGTTYHETPRSGDAFGPWSTDDSAPTVASTSHASSGPSYRTANDGFIDFVYGAYSGYLTRIDGARCEHRPTCSRYGFQAIKRHGYVLGAWMTVDRLLRPPRSSVLRDMPIYKVEEGRRYYYDPIENNDFWY